MRTLKFIVDGQILRPDPSCDFSGLVPGCNDELKAEFSFSKEWQNTAKVVGFYSRMGSEYPPQPLKDGKTCMIPVEATQHRVFKLRVFRKTKSGTIRTNRTTVEQKGG